MKELLLKLNKAVKVESKLLENPEINAELGTVTLKMPGVTLRNILLKKSIQEHCARLKAGDQFKAYVTETLNPQKDTLGNKTKHKIWKLNTIEKIA